MSNQARAIVDVLNRSHLWAKTLSESHREDTTDRVAKIADKLARAPGAQLCANQSVSRVHPIILHKVNYRRQRGRDD